MSRVNHCNISVLLIEDQPAEHEFIRDELSAVKNCEFLLTHAERLGKGLELLAENDYDVLLLDLCLPDSDGYETFQKAYGAAPGVPIILITNMDDEEQADRAVREGAQDYLIKRKMDSDLLSRSIRYAIERQQADEALRDSEERYALAVRGANDGLWDWDLTTGKVYYSERWHSMLGLDEFELDGTYEAWTKRIHPDDLQEFKRAMELHLESETEQFSHEHRIRSKSGHYLWVLSRGVAVADLDGMPQRMAGSMSDITARKRAEEQLMHDALHDHLTGLPNRNLMLDRLDQAIQRLRGRLSKGFAVLFMDLDRFKNVNDSLGHAIGDKLLVQTAERLTSIIRPGDTVARLGGDEFALLLADVFTLSQVTHIADRILEDCAKPVIIDGNEISTSVSIGITMGTDRYESAHEVLRDADIAMYLAKSEGKACYQIFDREMHQRVVKLQRLEVELRQAVERNEFILHYQPIVSLSNDGLVGFEALIRWNHPERGMVPPGEFIYAAEETGLIVPMGWWTLREACRQTKSWQDQHPSNPLLSISVNVSGKLFNQPDFVIALRRILKDTRLPATSLRIEITESVLLDHADESIAKLAELRKLGVGLHVDDFGTGYSSLSYLQKFNYDTLKIDRSFVQEVVDSDAIVQSIITLGKLLGMNIIAEGVETEDQLERLRELECPQVQGFWFSKPVDSARAAELLIDPQAATAGHIM
jgi:diguanylate cyclase (GGDEF)-like protein/PAS domain S-box-containing protein